MARPSGWVGAPGRAHERDAAGDRAAEPWGGGGLGRGTAAVQASGDGGDGVAWAGTYLDSNGQDEAAAPAVRMRDLAGARPLFE